MLKKKVISLVIDTTLTNEQLEESLVFVACCDKDADEKEQRAALSVPHRARNVRVLDSDDLEAGQLRESWLRLQGFDDQESDRG